jgi:3-hydroxybutyryl-CoA dehydratase
MSSESHRSALLDTWTETSSHMFDSMVAANRAAFAAFGVEQSELADATGSESSAPTDRIQPDEDLPEWHAETTSDDPADLGVGDSVRFTKTITDGDIRRFAAASGDTNPLHLDEDFATETRFKGRIAHGTLVGGLISAALARVPGLVIYLSQDLEFHNPVRVDDRVTAECEIVEDLGNKQFRLTTRVFDDDEVVIDGEAVIMVDSLPESLQD